MRDEETRAALHRQWTASDASDFEKYPGKHNILRIRSRPVRGALSGPNE
jgi:hypothetical protein